MKASNNRIIVYVVVGTVCLAALGVGGYFLFRNKKDNKNGEEAAATQGNTTQQTGQKSTANAAASSGPAGNFSSATTFGIQPNLKISAMNAAALLKKRVETADSNVKNTTLDIEARKKALQLRLTNSVAITDQTQDVDLISVPELKQASETMSRDHYVNVSNGLVRECLYDERDGEINEMNTERLVDYFAGEPKVIENSEGGDVNDLYNFFLDEESENIINSRVMETVTERVRYGFFKDKTKDVPEAYDIKQVLEIQDIKFRMKSAECELFLKRREARGSYFQAFRAFFLAFYNIKLDELRKSIESKKKMGNQKISKDEQVIEKINELKDCVKAIKTTLDESHDEEIACNMDRFLSGIARLACERYCCINKLEILVPNNNYTTGSDFEKQQGELTSKIKALEEQIKAKCSIYKNAGETIREYLTSTDTTKDIYDDKLTSNIFEGIIQLGENNNIRKDLYVFFHKASEKSRNENRAMLLKLIKQIEEGGF